eukprot:TRINITY_DN12326_c0_g1_i1.p1 TRINITY_DN12326_c0_g1~~TRINITY_DN12326_c0_g1_i1.p1  ORF type:complete len:228 (-),score=38.60 TRINITY_DN12326_c0_g1_i1:815-1399(-)
MEYVTAQSWFLVGDKGLTSVTTLGTTTSLVSNPTAKGIQEGHLRKLVKQSFLLALGGGLGSVNLFRVDVEVDQESDDVHVQDRLLFNICRKDLMTTQCLAFTRIDHVVYFAVAKSSYLYVYNLGTVTCLQLQPPSRMKIHDGTITAFAWGNLYPNLLTTACSRGKIRQWQITRDIEVPTTTLGTTLPTIKGTPY